MKAPVRHNRELSLVFLIAIFALSSSLSPQNVFAGLTSDPGANTDTQAQNSSQNGAQTVIFNPDPILRNLKIGNHGDDVISLREILTALGYIEDGNAAKKSGNDTFDRGLADALSKYQTDRHSTGLNPSGELDNTTLVLINADIAKLRAQNIEGSDTFAEASSSPSIDVKGKISLFLDNLIGKVASGMGGLIDRFKLFR